MAVKTSNHFKKVFLSGMLVCLPLIITVVILKLLLNMVMGLLSPLLQEVFPGIPIWVKVLLSVAGVVILVYLLGLATRHFLGHWLVTRLEQLLLRIPLLRTIYGSSRQVVDVFLNADRKTAFKEVALVEFPGPGLRALGFITGSVIDPSGAMCYKVFIPTTPNPTTGFLEIIEQSRVIRCDMTVEEGIKTIMSGGILGHEAIQQTTEAIAISMAERSAS